MPSQPTADQREITRRWVEDWQRAGAELEQIRRCEVDAVSTQEAIRQLFGSADYYRDLPPRVTSGLVEQQAWFAKLRSKAQR